MCGAEPLTPVLKRRIEDGFDAKIYDVYGCHEVNLVAAMCPVTDELHVCDDGLILEVLADGAPARPGERGEVFVTSLNSYAMPFIRYSMGDVATMGSDRCRCGAPFSTIRSVEGRTFDYFDLPNRASVHVHQAGLALTAGSYGSIRQYQLTQDANDRIVALVVPEPGASLDATALGRALDPLFGSDAEVVVRIVEEIPPGPSGKTPPYRIQSGHT